MSALQIVTSSEITQVDQYICTFRIVAPCMDKRAGTIRDPTVIIIREQ
jgi:hypothetical protein